MAVTIKSRGEILSDVIKDAEDHPKNWKAVFGKDIKRFSTDYYLFHPEVGLYLMKEYEKNPLERVGVGGKIARYVDEDITHSISTLPGNFGIVQGDFSKILRNIQKGFQPSDIINAALSGKDMGLTVPIQGSATTQSERYNSLRQFKTQSQKKIDDRFEKTASSQGVYSSYD
ncbi:MAG: hypothetical protein QCH96_01265 [Candidatus Thermoplasmatota archaeon]|nr:hypothetical protein [Candidatus Thermoplasmatota archaeon]